MESAQTISLAQLHAGAARKYNRFIDSGFESSNNTCRNCVRKNFGGPFCCNDGWPAGNKNWRDQGARCLNWTDSGSAPV